MNQGLFLSPGGRLFYEPQREADAIGAAELPTADEERLDAAFHESSAAGLIAVSALVNGSELYELEIKMTRCRPQRGGPSSATAPVQPAATPDTKSPVAGRPDSERNR